MAMALLVALACGVLLVWPAAAESFRERLDHANARLKSGDVEGAMGEYRDLQTDDPESPLLYYGMGRAQYERALQEVSLEAPEDALASFKEAKESFAKAVNAPEPDLREKARFNQANCTAQIAKQSVAAAKYDDVVESFRASVEEYEEFLRNYPDHQEARNNLDHMRYQLKKMLQNPPPPPEQQENQQQEKQDQEESQKEQQEQQPQEQEQQEQQEQEKPQEEQQEQQPQEQEQREQQEQEKPQEEQQEQQPQQPQQQQKEPSPEEQQDQAESEEEPQEKQNLEAILQSLEDMDKREVYDNINDRRRIRMESDWW